MILRNLSHYILPILGILLVNCSKAPVNSDIEGHWLLEEFTILETNEIVSCKRLYIGITYMVTELARKSGDERDVSFVARTEYNDDESVLILRDFKVNGFNTDLGHDATTEQLQIFGIVDPHLTEFRILQRKNKRLILESSYARLILKRF